MALTDNELKTHDSRTEKQYLENKKFWLNHTKDLYKIMVDGAVSRWEQNQEILEKARAKNLPVNNIKGLNETIGEIYDRLNGYFEKGKYWNYQNLIDRSYEDFFSEAIDKMNLDHQPNETEKGIAEEYAVGMIALVKQMTDIDSKNCSAVKEKAST